MKKWVLVLLAFAGASFLPAQDDATKTPKDFTCELLPRALRGSLSCAIPPNPFEGVLGDPPCSLGWDYDCLAWKPQPYVRLLKLDNQTPNRLWVSDSAGDSVVVCEIDDGKVRHCVLKGTHTLDDAVQAWVDINKINEAARKADERGCQQAINTVLKILAPRPAHAKSKKEQP